MSRLWDKGEPLDELVLRFTVGDDYLLDARLVPYDVRASIAHAEMLQERGYLSQEDCAAIRDTLRALAAEHAAGQWAIGVTEEDVHTALENRLTERLGAAGLRLHLGRSRNDQVLAALRLYLLDALADMGELASSVVAALERLAREQGGVPLPGYTHQQRAMPSSVALWAGGFAAEIDDDREGLLAASRRASKNPLGSAAGYGVPVIDLDRGATAAKLDFAIVQEPVTAVQLSRGKAEATACFELVMLGQDLGRLAAELVLFASSEFGFVRLPAALTTGSSIMPHKRNPDVFELVRGRAAQLPAELAAILAITAKLPSGYHRDLQLIKAPLFRALDSVADMARVMAHAVPQLEFDSQRASAAMDSGLYATREAYQLVQDEGVPFREAYRRIAAKLRPPAQ